MTVLNTGRINKRISALIDKERLNSRVAFAFDCFNTSDIVFSDYIMVKEQARKFQALMRAKGIEYTDDEALVGWMLSEIVLHKSVPIPDNTMKAIIKSSKVFRRGEVESNPYLRNIKPGRHTVGHFATDETSIAKYEIMGYTEAAMADDVLIPKLGIFDHKFTYPYIAEDGHVWMSVTPSEIETMGTAVERACGKVLTLGLGMGYFAYMAAIKNDVAHVTVVEKNSDVIELFKQYILPQFSCAGKISIVQADAFDYLEGLDDSTFDYCFADLWQSGNDLTPFVRCKKACRKFDRMKVDYWINDGMSIMFTACIKASILDAYFKNIRSKDWQVSEIPKCMNEYVSKIEILTAADVDFYTDMNNIDAIIAKIA